MEVLLTAVSARESGERRHSAELELEGDKVLEHAQCIQWY